MSNSVFQYQYDVAIVGESVPGVLLALRLQRSGSSTILFGNSLDNAGLESLLEVPPTPITGSSMSGLDFSKCVRRELASAGIPSGGVAIGIALKDSGAVVRGMIGEIDARRVVFSPLGSESGVPWLPSAEKLVGRGVSKDAWSDAPFFKNRVVAILGSDRRAGEQALIAASCGAKPIIICPDSRFEDRGLGVRLRQSGVIVKEGFTLKSVEVGPTGHLEAIVIIDLAGIEERVVAGALFLAQGLVCDWSVFEGVCREPFHPVLVKVGLADGFKYWDIEAQIAGLARV